MLKWHTLSVAKVLQELNASVEGLTEEEVFKRQALHGLNTVPLVSSEGWPTILGRQLNSPLIYVLLITALGTILLSKEADAIVIFSVVILNTLMGFIQDYKSGKAIDALLHFVPEKSRVLRNGYVISILAKELVPGDIVFLEAGDKVPADVRLIHTKQMRCDESALTGESLPTSKRIEPFAEDTPLAERECMAYSGTFVTMGTGQGVVVATGSQTEFGKISSLLKQVHVFQTPLLQTLGKVAKYITFAIIGMGVVVFVIAMARGYNLLDTLLASIAFAVAAIPEGLPATITITAAIGVQRMAKKRAIIRKLPAVETLGSTTIICTDKTGTLTENQMTVKMMCTPKHQYHVQGNGYLPEGEIARISPLAEQEEESALEELLMAAILCNDASMTKVPKRWIFSGDPTELALVVAGRKKGLNETEMRKQYPRLDVIPFSSEKGIMATLHQQEESYVLFVKGSPEALFSRADKKQLNLYQKHVEEMAKQGMRVLAIAKKQIPSPVGPLKEEAIASHLTLLGLVGMIDPPRKGVEEAIRLCQEAGIRVKMITGDHPLTAAIIGSELGLMRHDQVITGQQLEAAQGEEFTQLVLAYDVFARALPEHKLKIIHALQEKGEVVAMTGDGVNDTPALKQAHIGIAMGVSGTSVAKEVADMVLADDNFSSIEKAVEEGRRIFDNLVKSLAFVFPTNLAQALIIVVAVFFFPLQEGQLLLPILPIQILWVNLVVSVGLALPLAFEAQEPDLMQHPPRRQTDPLLNRFIWMRMLFATVMMVAGTVGLFLLSYRFTESIRESQTMAVTALMFFQMFYLLHCRSLRSSVFKIGLFSNPSIWIGILVTCLTQLAFVFLPFMQDLFRSTSLSLKEWLICMAVGLLISPAVALEKWLLRNRLNKT